MLFFGGIKIHMVFNGINSLACTSNCLLAVTVVLIFVLIGCECVTYFENSCVCYNHVDHHQRLVFGKVTSSGMTGMKIFGRQNNSACWRAYLAKYTLQSAPSWSSSCSSASSPILSYYTSSIGKGGIIYIIVYVYTYIACECSPTCNYYDLLLQHFPKYTFEKLRTPANVYIMNVAISDVLSCCIHSLSVYSAFRGRWSFGQLGK